MMPEGVTAGARAPGFTLDSDRGRIALSDLLARGRLVLAFYYEDSTPTCSTQIASLKDAFDMFRDLGASVLAVSADGLESHAAFCDRLGGLPFPLASDPDLTAARAYGVVDDSGRRARRAIFVIDRDGTVLLALTHYNPANVGDLQRVLEALSH